MPVVNCRVAVLRSRLKEPGRRIGQRGDATRAPDPGAKTGEGGTDAAPRRPYRDWPKSNPFLFRVVTGSVGVRTLSRSPLNRATNLNTCSDTVSKREFLRTAKPEEPRILADRKPAIYWEIRQHPALGRVRKPVLSRSNKWVNPRARRMFVRGS